MPENLNLKLQIAVCDDEPMDRQQAADLTNDIMTKEILLPTEKGQSRLAPSSIIYVEPWERGARLQLTSGPLETSVRISELAAMLPERSFIFCHRTILVNLAFIKHLRSCEIELADGRILPVSKHRIPDLKKRLLGYMQG